MFQGNRGPSKDVQAKYDEILGWISNMVKGGYIAGTSFMTLADLSVMANYASLRNFGSVDTKKWAFIEAWFQRCKQQVPKYDEVCGMGADIHGTAYKKSKSANNRK